MSTPKRKLKYALISFTVSFSCGREKFVWSPPSVSVFNRCVAINRSWGLRNHAEPGPAGIKKKNKTPSKTVRDPQMMNIAFHGTIAILAWPMPYIIKAPRTWASPLQLIHILYFRKFLLDAGNVGLSSSQISYPIRGGCSLFLYQILVSVTKAGETAPSANPRANRTPMNDEKVVAAARHWFCWSIPPSTRQCLIIRRWLTMQIPPQTILFSVSHSNWYHEHAGAQLTLDRRQTWQAASDSSDT